MALLINNDITRRVLEMPAAIASMQAAFEQLGGGLAVYQTRTDLWSPTARDGDYYRWGSLLGAISDPPTLAFRFKSDVITWTEYADAVTEEWHNIEPGRYMGFILLFDTTNGELIGMLNDGIIQHVRVAATAALGAKHGAKEDARDLAMIGSGWMARAYAEAMAAVRPIERVRVFSPTPENRDRYAREMSETLGIEIQAVDSVEKAVRGADIVATCTDSRRAVFSSQMLEPGMFVVDTRPEEIDEATYAEADRVMVTTNAPLNELVMGTEDDRDRLPQAKSALYRRRYVESDFPLTLPEIVTGHEVVRTSPDDTIIYHNLSAGIQFAAVGRLVYERAREAGLGVQIPIDWFLQDIRN